MKTKNYIHFFCLKVWILIVASFCAADVPENEMLKKQRFSVQMQEHSNLFYMTGSRFRRTYSSVDFDLEVLNEDEVLVRIAQVDIDPTIIKSDYEKENWNKFDTEKLKGMSFVLLRKNKRWVLRDHENADFPFGGEIVIGYIMSAFPLIFPYIPSNFLPLEGFEWSINSTKKDMSFSSKATINDFKIVDVHELPELYKVAVIKGEQKYVRTGEEFSSMVNRLIYIQYDVNSKMGVNAFERYTMRRKGTSPLPQNDLSMYLINVLRIPNIYSQEKE